ncbi:hypothetical protein KR044_010840, partial [Drosophila immigrans]
EVAPTQVITPKNQRRKATAKVTFTVVPDPQAGPDGGAWVIESADLERWIRQTDFENDEAVGYLADRFAKA